MSTKYIFDRNMAYAIIKKENFRRYPMKKALLFILSLLCLSSLVPLNAAVTDRYSREIKFYNNCGLEITEDQYVYGLPCKKTVSYVSDLLATKDEIVLLDSGNKALDITGFVGTSCKITRTHAGFSSGSYTFVVSGDINGDGSITSTDYLKIKKSFAGAELKKDEKLAADVDRNGKVVSADYLLVKKYFSGINLFEKELPEIPVDNSPYTLGTFDTYNLDTCMEPVWNSRIIYNESCFMLGSETASARLMYTPDEILGVYNYNFTKKYVEGTDYIIEGNKIVKIEGSSIKSLKESRYYNTTSIIHTYNESGAEVPTYYGESTAMTQYQIFVTYTHKDYWTGFKVENQSNRYENLIKKLNSGEDVTIIFYGDSITNGANSSYHLNISPFTPTWAMLLTENIAKKYGYKIEYIDTGIKDTQKVPTEGHSYGNKGTIRYINTAIGGWRSESGYENFSTHLAPFISEYGCDLFVCAFGMNDPDLLPEIEASNNERIINKVHSLASDSAVLLVSPMPLNVDCSDPNWNGNQKYFEPAFFELSDKLSENGKEAAAAPVYSFVKSVLDYKLYRDITGNNLNHTNDFLTRLYAQACYQTIIGY